MCKCVCVGACALEHVFLSNLWKISINSHYIIMYMHIYRKISINSHYVYAHLKLECPSIFSLTITVAEILLYSYFVIPSYVRFNQSV